MNSVSPRAENSRGDDQSLVRRAMQAVTDHIRTHALHVGDTLPGEAQFAAELSVSRPVVREAFGSLAALRLIDVGNGRRARVAAIDGSVFANSLSHAVTTAQITVSEVWEVRRTIELRTACLAAESRTAKEAERICELAEAMARDLGDPQSITRHDISFHEAIARASHNALFVQIVASFATLMQVAVPQAWATRTTERQRQTIIKRHRSVAEAIRKQDGAVAEAAMNAHFDDAVGQSLKIMASRS